MWDGEVCLRRRGLVLCEGEREGEGTYGAGPALAGGGVDDVAEDLLVEA